MCSFRGYPPVPSAVGIYFLFLASVDANVQQATSRSDGPYGLQSWTHEPMFVDEPRWILFSQRTPGQSNSNEEADDHFWVARGRKRYLYSPRPPTVLDRRVRYLLKDDDEDSWALRGKKGQLNNILENDPFWVNRGKKADTVSPDGENRAGISNDEVYRGTREVRTEVGDVLNDDLKWANRDKKEDLTSTLRNGDQFWVNRGKKGDLQSSLNGGDKFWVNRGKKNEIQSMLNGGDQFWVNRGKKNELQPMLNAGDAFWVNRGKKNELQSFMNNGNPFWVNRGRRNELQSVLNSGDPFWVNRGKKNELQSLLNNGDQFWVNRGKKDELQSLLSNGDQFWVKQGKKGELQSTLSGGDQFWVNRGKKNELQSTLNNGEPFWVNRGKRSELQSMFGGGDKFWVNRGKKDSFHGNTMEMGGHQNPDDANSRGKLFKNSLAPGEPLLWYDSVWNGRLKKDPLKTILRPDPFFVNRGKKSLDKPKGNINETRSRDKQDKRTKRQLFWETSLLKNKWLDRGKKTNDRPEKLDPFGVTRGKRMVMHNRQRRDVTETTTKPFFKSTLSPRRKRMAKSPRVTSLYDRDYPYKKDSDVNSLLLWWKDKSTPGEMQDEEDILGVESMVMQRLGENIAKVEPFWVNRGKKDVGADDEEFVEEVPEKRGDAAPSDVSKDLGALTHAGETFWVARG